MRSAAISPAGRSHRTAVFRCVPTGVGVVLALAVSAAPTVAQGPSSAELFEATWTEGIDVALERYRAAPAESRSAEVLVGLADQLLWTGKRDDAMAALALAETEAPGAADIAFQQGRAHLQRGESTAALAAFARGLDVVEADPSLSGDERDRLRARLRNRVRFLERADELIGRTGAYRRPDGHVLFFKFDPYINTFPALVEAETGRVRVLYPADDGSLYWTDGDGEPAGSLAFRGAAGNAGAMQLETPRGTVRAAGLGIRREHVRFDAGNAVIDATLFLPREASPAPAVVLTHGAGLSSRYNLAHEAVAFAAAGVAALVYDKPGLGRSEGGNWLLLSIPDQARYVTAAVDRLSRRDDVTAVGVWGFSQGGWVAPLAAAGSDEVAFVVMASGAAVSPQEQSLQATVLRLEGEGATDDQINAAVAYTREMWSRVNAGEPLDAFADLNARAAAAPWGDHVQRMRMDFELAWWRENEVDAGSALEALRVPTLALFGQNDDAVPPRDNVPLMARHLARAPAADYTIAVLPDADHQFTSDGDYHPLYFRTMTTWVADRFRRN